MDYRKIGRYKYTLIMAGVFLVMVPLTVWSWVWLIQTASGCGS